jgi:hypothetical protein
MGDADLIDAAMDDGTDNVLELPSCCWALIGVGRDCGGRKTRHWSQSLDARIASVLAWDQTEGLLSA